MPRRLLPAVFAAVLGLSGPPAFGHEFWIEPERYQVETGAALVGDLKNGQHFDGRSIAYFQARTERFEMIRASETIQIGGGMGQVPALQVQAPETPGLAVIIHQTDMTRLAYTNWAEFEEFAAEKDFADIRARHMARGLPETGFTEQYARYAKALVAVGHGRGADAPTGLETEFVALANPYTDKLSDGFAFRLLYQGIARADAQVEIFDRAPDGTTHVTRTRTDAGGRAVIPVKPGHTYLLDAVVLRPAPENSGADWETLWAALTFRVP